MKTSGRKSSVKLIAQKCDACGYNLDGLDIIKVCPECGRDKKLQRQVRRVRVSILILLPLGIVLLGLLLFFLRPTRVIITHCSNSMLSELYPYMSSKMQQCADAEILHRSEQGRGLTISEELRVIRSTISDAVRQKTLVIGSSSIDVGTCWICDVEFPLQTLAIGTELEIRVQCKTLGLDFAYAVPSLELLGSGRPRGARFIGNVAQYNSQIHTLLVDLNQITYSGNNRMLRCVDSYNIPIHLIVINK